MITEYYDIENYGVYIVNGQPIRYREGICMFKSLKSKITGLVCIIALVPLIISNGFQLNSAKDIYTNEVKSEYENIAIREGEVIDSWIKAKIALLENTYNNNTEFKTGDKKIIVPILGELQKHYVDVLRFCFIDKNGILTNSQGLEVDVSGQEHFKKAVELKKVVVSDIIKDSISGGKIIVFNKPIISDKGEFMGVLQCVGDASFIEELILDTKVGRTGYGYLLNKDGKFLVHKDTTKVGKDFKNINSDGWKIFKDSVFKNKSGYMEYFASDNTDRIAAYDTVPLVGWKFIITAETEEIFQEYNKSSSITSVLILITSGITAILAFIFAAGIVKRIKMLINIVDNTAKFNLVDAEEFDEILKEYESRAENKDEIQSAIQAVINMRKELRDLINNIKEKSNKVWKSSDNLSHITDETSKSIEGVAHGTDELAQGAYELAKNMEDSAMKLNSLSQEIDGITKATDSMKEYIERTKNANEKGMNIIDNLEVAVKTNVLVSEKIESQVNLLDKNSESIEKITDTIQGIADQINLLSLNAAIEAARAGEQGKGFAVLAEEIRKLANETAISTKEIGNIVSTIKNTIKDTKLQMDESKTVIDETSMASKNTKVAFGDIENSTKNIILEVDKLIESINEMNINKNGVISAVEGVSAIAEESASTTEEIAASVQQQFASMEQLGHSFKDLKAIAESLDMLVKKFKT